MPVARPVAERFWEKVEKTDSCWLWTASLNTHGYGQISIHNRPRVVHRVAHELLVGPISEGLRVCHHCDVRHCVRPDHLFLGTAKDNTQDMMSKGRGRFPGSGMRGDRSGARSPQRRVRRDEVLRLYAQGMRQIEIAHVMGMSPSNVSYIVHGKSWT